MSGAWELKKQNSVLVAILHVDTTTVAWAFGLRNLIIPGPSPVALAGMPYDMARNVACRHVLENGQDWLFFLDSVPDYTPILIKQDGLVNCIPICDLAVFSGTNKEYVYFRPEEDVKVFVGEQNGGWSAIRHVLRHPFSGHLYRINTHSGVVDVSANHSVIRGGRAQNSVAGKDIRVGMQLSMPYERGRYGKEKRFFFGTPELAWFYGFFAAEGCASKGNGVHVDNNNVVHLKRCQEVVRTFFGKDLKIHTASTSNREIETKRIATSGRRIFNFFREKFYNSLGQKKIPMEILNAPESIKRQFLQGYYDGDGHTRNGKWVQFSTNSPTLALGIQWLLQTATRQTYAVQIRSDKLNIVGVTVNQEDSQAKRGRPQYRPRGLVKKVCKVPYSGYLYDIETDKHVFAGGVGPILLHNSDVIPPANAILKLMSHRQPFISGLYCRRSPPHGVPVMMRSGQWVTQYKPGSVVEVDVVGSGCLLIHRTLLEKCPPQRPGKPWFDWRVDMQGILPPGECMSEDFTLCNHIRRLGLAKVLVDTSVVCRHVGFGSSTYGRFDPLEVVSVT